MKLGISNKKRSSIVKCLLVVFSLLFLLYPVSYASLSGGATILAIIAISAFVLLPRLRIRVGIPEKYHLAIVIGLAVLTRVGIVLLLNEHVDQASDFEIATSQVGNLSLQDTYHRLFVHWDVYPIILSLIGKIFGNSQLMILLTNAFVLTASAVLIYQIAKILLKNSRHALMASLIYIVWPANILYTVIANPEHFAVLTLLIGIYALLSLASYFNSKGQSGFKPLKIAALTALAGTSLGLSMFFKGFAPVILIAFLIYLVMNSIYCRTSRIYFYLKTTIMILLVVFYGLTQTLVYKTLDHIAGAPVAKNSAVCYLNVGLRGRGTYNSYHYQICFDAMEKYNFDTQLANEEILASLKDYYRRESSLGKFAELIERKARVAAAGDTGGENSQSSRIFWIKQTAKTLPGSRWIGMVSDAIFLGLTALAAIGLIRMVKTLNLQIFLLYLIYFGGMSMLLLVESQHRYLYAIEWILCILGVYGLATLTKLTYNGK